jgi:hypothetical protein
MHTTKYCTLCTVIYFLFTITFLRNISWLSTDFTPLYPRRLNALWERIVRLASIKALGKQILKFFKHSRKNTKQWSYWDWKRSSLIINKILFLCFNCYIIYIYICTSKSFCLYLKFHAVATFKQHNILMQSGGWREYEKFQNESLWNVLARNHTFKCIVKRTGRCSPDRIHVRCVV